MGESARVQPIFVFAGGHEQRGRRRYRLSYEHRLRISVYRAKFSAANDMRADGDPSFSRGVGSLDSTQKPVYATV